MAKNLAAMETEAEKENKSLKLNFCIQHDKEEKELNF